MTLFRSFPSLAAVVAASTLALAGCTLSNESGDFKAADLDAGAVDAGIGSTGGRSGHAGSTSGGRSAGEGGAGTTGNGGQGGSGGSGTGGNNTAGDGGVVVVDAGDAGPDTSAPEPACDDGEQNGDESDIDCGGSCNGCTYGDACAVDADCGEGGCRDGVCAIVHCDDQTLNADETDFDCGGSECAPCGANRACNTSADCQSSVCTDNVCKAATCSDGAQNSTETDIDCGGGACAGCDVGDSCLNDSDCTSAVCTGGVCAGPSCSDSVLNGTESDIDCGGDTCDPCPLTATCTMPSDCASDFCFNSVCQAATCNDGQLNGNESDIDCGGDSCAPCIAPAACGANSDCASSVCTGNICQTPTCSDGVQNANESDIDCGGGCAQCTTGKTCDFAGDCESAVCMIPPAPDPTPGGDGGVDGGDGGTADGGAPPAPSSVPVCIAASCDDLAANGDESDVDCGGSCPNRCVQGDTCSKGSDCAGGFCLNNICTQAQCNDSALNGTETDVDCGGPTCPKCAAGDFCATGADCTSKICGVDKLCRAAQCNDSVKNGDETDVDCGGSCAPCVADKACLDGTDCTSGVCAGGLCQVPSCSDATENGNETDVDCGGTACGPCTNGGGCGQDSDCVSKVCTGSSCATPTCSDTTRNGTETDVDCGGSCADCGTGKGCSKGSDCLTGYCASDNTCQPPGCGDGVKNGNETDTDCGGGCPGCGAFEACSVDSDCNSFNCVGGACQPATCNDGIKNQTETDVDCGGGSCAACDTGDICNGSNDCISKVCSGTCIAPSCSDGVINGFESDVDCGGSDCPGCGGGKTCRAPVDCSSQVCTSGSCQQPSCTDQKKNGTETDVDCGGACNACSGGQGCGNAGDCTSLVCIGAVCQNPDVCNPGFSDCDSNPANGCETTGSVCYYSQTITIQNANATALTNHQVRIDLPDTNPLFTPMHLASAAGNDIRIVQADGTTAVPYWIESLNSGNAASKGRIWVKVTVPANSSIVVYLRYGLPANAGSPLSNIHDPVTPENGVMEWGDDFSGTIDTQPSSARWAAPIPATNIAALSGSGELLWKNTGTSATARLRSVPTFTGSIIQDVKFRSVTRFGGGLQCAGYFTAAADCFGSLINPGGDFYRNNSTWSSILAPQSADNIDYRLTVQALQEATTIGGGTATATGTTNNLEPNGPVSIVFDGNAGAYVRGGGTTNSQTYNLPVTIAYQYPGGARHSITSYSIQVAGDAAAYRTRNPQDWTLQGSDNGSTWTTVDTRTTANMPGVNDAWVTYTLPTPSAPYQRFRLNITRRFGNDPYIAIAELVLNGAPVTGTLANYATSANVYSYSAGHVVAADPVAIGFRYDDSASSSYTNQAGDLRFDWILTRKYAAIPPTVTVPTTETAFSRSQTLTVTNTGGAAQTNFQVRLQIGPGNTDFWNNLDGGASATGHDIRIRDGLGADLSYWIEKLDTAADVAWIWVKVPTIAAPPAVATLRMFYGDGSLPAASNIANTMIFGDEFAGSSVDVSKWTVVDGAGASVSGGQLHATSTAMRIQALGAAGGTVTTATQAVVAETRFRINTGFNQGIQANGVYTDAGNAFGVLPYWAGSTGGAGGNVVYYRDGGGWEGPTNYNDYSDWTLSSIVLRGGTNNSASLRRWVDGSGAQAFTGAASYTPSAAPLTLGDRYDGNMNADTGSADWEWILLRKYAATPPTLTASGG